MIIRRSTILMLALLALAAGCHDAKAHAPLAKPVAALSQPDPTPAPNPLDAAPAPPQVFQISMYVITMPQNTFSGNEDFWKRIDEQCVDPGTADILQKNGMRVGIGGSDELPHLDKYLEGVVPVQKFSTTAAEVKNMEVEMKGNLPEQLIFHFDNSGTPVGRSFGQSNNIMNVSFSPAPRKPGALRLTLCPMIRTIRQRLEIQQVDDSYQFIYINPESNYDMNFKVDIMPGSFLIVTPSPQAYMRTSVGNAFFLKDSPAEKLEQVMIIIPVAMTDAARNAKRAK